jgi:hypothetical protein
VELPHATGNDEVPAAELGIGGNHGVFRARYGEVGPAIELLGGEAPILGGLGDAVVNVLVNAAAVDGIVLICLGDGDIGAVGCNRGGGTVLQVMDVLPKKQKLEYNILSLALAMLSILPSVLGDAAAWKRMCTCRAAHRGDLACVASQACMAECWSLVVKVVVVWDWTLCGVFVLARASSVCCLQREPGSMVTAPCWSMKLRARYLVYLWYSYLRSVAAEGVL